MSSEAVKRHILLALDALNVPTTQMPSRRQVAAACGAAKQLRNRLLREHARTLEHIASLRQKLMFNDDDNDADTDLQLDEASSVRGVCVTPTDALDRPDFLFLLELRAMEKIVVPLLLAHGLAFRETLLPQLLKLLAAVLLPIPRYSRHQTEQLDAIQRVRRRCANDELFALLVQCLAPVTERRVDGQLTREDVVLIEVVLTVMEQLLNPQHGSSAETIAPFVRMHGVELLLVFVGQNVARLHERQAKDERNAVDAPTMGVEDGEAVHEVVDATTTQLVVLEDDDESSDAKDDAEAEHDSASTCDEASEASSVLSELDRQYANRISAMLESDEQLFKWNRLILAIFAHLFASVSVAECVHLLYAASAVTSDGRAGALSALGTNARLRECVRERNAWRHVASRRNGAITSTGLIVRASSHGDLCRHGKANAPRDEVESAAVVQPLGAVSTLIGPQSSRGDSVEVMRTIDLRKRGRFIRGMYQQSEQVSDLPLLVKLQLARQMQSFACMTFGAVTEMLWARLRQAARSVEQAALEYAEVVAASRGTEDATELSSPVDATVFESVTFVLHWLHTCAVMIRQLRETVRVAAERVESRESALATGQKMSQSDDEAAAAVRMEWHALTSVVDVEHIDCGFALLRAFLQCRELRVRINMSIVVTYIAEMLMLLLLLIDGEVVGEAELKTAASAIASAILYNEAHIKAVFELMGECGSHSKASATSAQICTLLVATLLQLMERCSFGGKLTLPKQKRKPAASDVVAHTSCVDESQGHMKEGGESDHLLTVDEDGEEDAVGEVGEQSTEALMSPQHDDVGSVAAVSATTGTSTLISEREVELQSYIRRLAQQRYAGVFQRTLHTWRVNDADVNLALAYLLRLFMQTKCEGVLFNVSFLLPMREVIVHGAQTHRPLHAVCDDVVFAFFNPIAAKQADADMAVRLTASEATLLSGAQSFLGFEVSLRCARALFTFSGTEYALLDERASPNLMFNASLPLRTDANREASGEDEYADVDESRPRARRRRMRREVKSSVPESPSTMVFE